MNLRSELVFLVTVDSTQDSELVKNEVLYFIVEV